MTRFHTGNYAWWEGSLVPISVPQLVPPSSTGSPFVRRWPALPGLPFLNVSTRSHVPGFPPLSTTSWTFLRVHLLVGGGLFLPCVVLYCVDVPQWTESVPVWWTFGLFSNFSCYRGHMEWIASVHPVPFCPSARVSWGQLSRGRIARHYQPGNLTGDWAPWILTGDWSRGQSIRVACTRLSDPPSRCLS